MTTLAALPTPRLRARPVRCACDHCGAHLMARWAFRVAGACGNCGSYEITPIAPAVVGGRTEGRRLPGAAAHAPAH